MCLSSTSSSNGPEVRRFLRRLGVFLLPLLAAALPFEIMAWRSGECWPVARVADAMSDGSRRLYMRKYFSQQYTLYQAEMLRRRAPDLVILGSSRVWQFRSFMFEPLDRGAYNAGGMVQNVKDLETYVAWVRRGTVPRPRAVILGVDPWWMKRGEPEGTTDRNREFDEAFRPVAHFDGIRNMIVRGRIPWSLLLHDPPPVPGGYRPLGLMPLQDGKGFRPDGSVFSGQAVLDEFQRTGAFRDRLGIAAHIREQSFHFTACPGVDWKRAEELIGSLRELRDGGSEIAVFLPPFSTECVEAFRASPGLSAWWREYSEDFPRRVEAAGFHCLVSLSPADYGLGDAYMIDGYHPGEVLMSFVAEDLIRRARPGGVLSRIDPRRLQVLRSQPGVTPLSFPGN